MSEPPSRQSDTAEDPVVVRSEDPSASGHGVSPVMLALATDGWLAYFR